ncbi:MAG: hypothetical protein EOP50_18825 [Sphingobacteriales bacterium]|nr:MAG: hypothetical protein EOP50_18825 [Sphingobacteriales bacterium]
MKVQQPQRGFATFILSILAFATLLWIEGSPFNLMFGVMFLPLAARQLSREGLEPDGKRTPAFSRADPP